MDPASRQITRLTTYNGGLLRMGATSMPIDAESVVSVGPSLLAVAIRRLAGTGTQLR